jgi:CheY-like chemotaxis protein
VIIKKRRMKQTMSEILVIEDNDIMQDLLKLMMEKEGHAVKTAENGLIAIDLLKKHTFDLVITDLIMPVKGGLEIIQLLQNTRPYIPIIAISGGAHISSDVYLDIAKDIGAKYVFQKPFTLDEFIRAVRTSLTPS